MKHMRRCELPTDGALTYWYDKREAFSQWDKPDNQPLGIKDYLRKQFRKADADGTGAPPG